MNSAMDVSAERWLPVPGHFGYEASSLGQIRSIDRVITRKDGTPHPLRGKVLCQYTMARGHLQVTLNRGVKFLSHHVIMFAFVGPRPDGLECCHNDGNPANNRLENLRWDTLSSNHLDRVRHGTHTMSRRTHCPRSHSLTEPNLMPWMVINRGYRGCLACHRANSYVRYWSERGVSHDMQIVSDRYYEELMTDFRGLCAAREVA